MTLPTPEVLAIIPARGGSRAVPRKNIARVAGRPLIAWTIDAAQSASCVSRVIVSTDDPEIAQISRDEGVEAPFLRPAAISGADSPTSSAVRHALDWLKEHENYVPDYVVVLQPTSPLRLATDIDRAMAIVTSTNAVGAVSVSRSNQHPYWTFSVNESGQLVSLPFSDTAGYARRQDLPPAFILNGAIYIVRTDEFDMSGLLVPQGSVSYVMPEERALDINTRWDLRIADLVMREDIASPPTRRDEQPRYYSSG